MALRVLLADDHHVIRTGLCAFLEQRGFTVVAEASDGREAVHQCENFQPDVAILDFSMPGMNGVAASIEIQRVSPATRVIILSVHDEDHYVLDALRAGSKGYLLKRSAADLLVTAIQQVSRGKVFLSPDISATVVNAFLSPNDVPEDPLTAREREVLQLVAEGDTTREIAGKLGISRKTVDSHRTHIMDKLNIHGTPGLVRFAIRRGLIEA